MYTKFIYCQNLELLFSDIIRCSEHDANTFRYYVLCALYMKFNGVMLNDHCKVLKTFSFTQGNIIHCNNRVLVYCNNRVLVYCNNRVLVYCNNRVLVYCNNRVLVYCNNRVLVYCNNRVLVYCNNRVLVYFKFISVEYTIVCFLNI